MIEYTPITEPIHISVESMTSIVDGRTVMLGGMPQCPMHRLLLGSFKCYEHDGCVVTKVCAHCVEEQAKDD